LDESHKLDPWLLSEAPIPKKCQIPAKPTWHHFGGEINWFKPLGEKKKT